MPAYRPSLGAVVDRAEAETRFRVWAPDASRLELVIESGSPRVVPMAREQDGCFLVRHSAPPGTLYRYRIDGRGPFPDPASRWQPAGVHGPSAVVDPWTFPWRDAAWRGTGMAELVLYELHVGTFTPEGTFRAAAAKLGWLAELGVTAVELMPVADFPGNRNWGYDGVALFSPARCYGTPDELRAFVNEAHRVGLAVHLDVVYNHFGPDGAYQGVFSRRYHSESHDSPWGRGINYDGAGAAQVRRYVSENALHWIHEYHIDGLRLDATHAIVDDSAVPVASEIARAVHDSTRGQALNACVIAEDHRNLSVIVRQRDEGGWGLDGCWSDDFHHQVRRALTGDRDGYFADFSGSLDDLAVTIRDGWFFQGQQSTYFHGPRGTPTERVPLRRFVVFLQNHDQVGNRAFGERLHHDVSGAVYRAASVLLLLLPGTPLLFMGQEWAATTPFLYFTDHHEELGRAVTAGRRREFRRFERFSDPRHASRIPDPQDRATFEACRLRWEEIGREPHAGTLRLYRAMLALRRAEPALRHDITSGAAGLVTVAGDALLVRRDAPGARSLLAAVRLSASGPACIDLHAVSETPWHLVLTSEDAAWTIDGTPPTLADASTIRFSGAAAVVMASGPAT